MEFWITRGHKLHVSSFLICFVASKGFVQLYICSYCCTLMLILKFNSLLVHNYHMLESTVLMWHTYKSTTLWQVRASVFGQDSLPFFFFSKISVCYVEVLVHEPNPTLGQPATWQCTNIQFNLRSQDLFQHIVNLLVGVNHTVWGNCRKWPKAFSNVLKNLH